MASAARLVTHALLGFRRIVHSDELVVGLLALVVGLVAGFGVVGFLEGFAAIQELLFGAGDDHLAEAARQLAWWHILLIPTGGGLLVGLYHRYVQPGGRGHGVADVIEAAVLRRARMSLRQGLAAIAGSALSIGVGASVGREGPAVHLGATFGGWVAGRLRLGRSLSRTLLGCGVASAVAASFNAPIAGALFAHEVVLESFALSGFAPVVIAAVAGTVVSRLWFGDFPAFTVPPHTLASPWEFPAMVGLGLLCGLAALTLMRSIFAVQDTARRLPLPSPLAPMLGGALVGLIAIPFPEVLGIGYQVTDLALDGSLPILTLVALALAKLAATGFSLGSGFAGGVFSPPLTIGALLGGAYGVAATTVFPELSSGPGAYAVVGMGAMAAAVLGAPISTTLIIFEMTANYQLTVAVMIAVVVSVVTSRQVSGYRSFFHWQLARRGIRPDERASSGVLNAIRLRSLLRPIEGVAVQASADLPLVRQRLLTAPSNRLFVTDGEGRFVGAIGLTDLGEAAFGTERDGVLRAGDVARGAAPTLCLRDDAGRALALFSETAEPAVAVIDDPRTKRLVGWIAEADLLRAQTRAVMAARVDETAGVRSP